MITPNSNVTVYGVPLINVAKGDVNPEGQDDVQGGIKLPLNSDQIGLHLTANQKPELLML